MLISLRSVFILVCGTALASCRAYDEATQAVGDSLESLNRPTPTPTPFPKKPTPTPTVNTTPTPTPIPGNSTPTPTPGPVSANTSSVASWFPSTWYFNQSIRNAAKDTQSDVLIQKLIGRGGWGTGTLRIDFSIDVYYANASSPRMITSYDDPNFPDNDYPSLMPVPPSGTQGFEEGSRTCGGGDCHYIVVDAQPPSGISARLIEVYRANAPFNTFEVQGSLAIWEFNKNYPEDWRGDHCTSADAGGFPISPMLFTPQEIQAGEIKHAIRLILPNSRIAYRRYAHPATHGTGSSGWAPTADGIYYGARFRLKSSFDENTLPTAGAKVVARALKEYGMILADGGNIALTAIGDTYSPIKWSSVLGSNDLSSIPVSAFEIVQRGTEVVNPPDFYDCYRTPIHD